MCARIYVYSLTIVYYCLELSVMIYAGCPDPDPLQSRVFFYLSLLKTKVLFGGFFHRKKLNFRCGDID